MAEGVAADEASFLLESTVRGHHIFKRIWTPVIGSCCRFKLKLVMSEIIVQLPRFTMTTPTNVRCDLYSGTNDAFGA